MIIYIYGSFLGWRPSAPQSSTPFQPQQLAETAFHWGDYNFCRFVENTGKSHPRMKGTRISFKAIAEFLNHAFWVSGCRALLRTRCEEL